MENVARKTVIVGMSGGVDSAVSALLLKEQGAKVVGIFMKNWEQADGKKECSSADDYRDVEKVCRQIGIPYYSMEFIEEYRREVFASFLAKYRSGVTPNPDILCNSQIKFKHFFNQAIKLGADFLATGHYCKKLISGKNIFLATPKDKSKDQTYFLHAIKEDILAKVIFPLQDLNKAQVRAIAKETGLCVSEKKDSTGICFIGKQNFKNFLSRYIPVNVGEFKTLSGKVVGEHSGAAFYTLGQRKGLGLGGPGEPWFVVDKDMSSNTVFVERGEHPALYSKALTAVAPSWINSLWAKKFSIGSEHKIKAQVRYRQPRQECILKVISQNEFKVSFCNPQRAIAPGQSVVFYDHLEGEEVCLGGAEILSRALSGSFPSPATFIPKDRDRLDQGFVF